MPGLKIEACAPRLNGTQALKHYIGTETGLKINPYYFRGNLFREQDSDY